MFLIDNVLIINIKSIKMKKFVYFIVLFFAISTVSAADGNSKSKSAKEESDITVVKDKITSEKDVSAKKMSEEEMNRLVKRVDEIRKMDKSKLSNEEKKDLRKELKEYKKEIKKRGYVLYLSGSAILIIILILLLV